MATSNVLLPDAQYDVFLSVGFGFCYSSALFPLIRILEKLKKGEPDKNRCVLSKATITENAWSTKILMIRGFLTIVGLACLYGWYAFYLRGFYGNSLVPAHRILLDWISLGLFAVGANWWDNQDHHENIYCLVEALAVFAFGITCALILWQHGTVDSQTTSLFRAIFWCVMLFSCYAYFAIMTRCAKRVYDASTEKSSRDQTLSIIRSALIFFAILAIIDWFTLFVTFNPVMSSSTTNEIRLFGLAEKIVCIAMFLIVHGFVGYFAIQINDKKTRAKFRSILITQLPMATLILVTIFNHKNLFYNR